MTREPYELERWPCGAPGHSGDSPVAAREARLLAIF
jgi:hypothetical protein